MYIRIGDEVVDEAPFDFFDAIVIAELKNYYKAMALDTREIDRADNRKHMKALKKVLKIYMNPSDYREWRDNMRVLRKGEDLGYHPSELE